MSVGPLNLSTCYIYQASSEALIDQTLPFEVFKVMLGHLDTVDEINDAKSVSKYWYAATLSMVKDLNILRLAKLCGVLPLTLKEEDSKAMPLCDSFKGLQAAIFKTREKVVDLLKPLRDEELDKLECEPCRFFEHTISLTKVCKAIDNANTIFDLMGKGVVLHECSAKLASMRMMKKALDVTRKIEHTFWKQMSFANISSIFVANGKVAQAIEIQLTEMIKGDVNTDVAISITALAMGRAGQILQAKMHAENIQCPDRKAYCLGLIEIVGLCKQAQFKEAETLADSYEKAKKSDAYQEISFEVHRIGQWEECLRVADAIPTLETREHWLNVLMFQEEGDEAKVAQVIELLEKNDVTLEFDDDF